MDPESSETIHGLVSWIKGWLAPYVPGNYLETASRGIALVFVLLVCWIAYLLARRVLLRSVGFIIRKTPNRYDDILLERKVFFWIAHLAPAIVYYFFTPALFSGFEVAARVSRAAIVVYMIVVGMLALSALIDGINDIYRRYGVSKEAPIKTFLQIGRLVLYIIGGILIASAVLGKSPIYILSGLGALTAVLMLVFKDTLLGFVAGIQLAVNRMIARGDWIEMPRFGADGVVLEIALSTVKVQNWDKTITTIPTYSLISDSFKNWRGMVESNGRRIKRSVFVDLNSVRFCDDELLGELKRIHLMAPIIEESLEEIEAFNKAQNVDESMSVNGRRLTNIGLFRAYLESYLKAHPEINQEMTLLVRQRAPEEKGLPVEIYAFTKVKTWIPYEKTQANIFDHILASAKTFDLVLYQAPTGADIRKGLDKFRA